MPHQRNSVFCIKICITKFCRRQNSNFISPGIFFRFCKIYSHQFESTRRPLPHLFSPTKKCQSSPIFEKYPTPTRNEKLPTILHNLDIENYLSTSPLPVCQSFFGGWGWVSLLAPHLPYRMYDQNLRQANGGSFRAFYFLSTGVLSLFSEYNGSRVTRRAAKLAGKTIKFKSFISIVDEMFFLLQTWLRGPPSDDEKTYRSQ